MARTSALGKVPAAGPAEACCAGSGISPAADQVAESESRPLLLCGLFTQLRASPSSAPPGGVETIRRAVSIVPIVSVTATAEIRTTPSIVVCAKCLKGAQKENGATSIW